MFLPTSDFILCCFIYVIISTLFLFYIISSKYPACEIYYGECEQNGDNYIGKTVRNTVTRWLEHNNPDKSEAAEHIYAQVLYRSTLKRT